MWVLALSGAMIGGAVIGMALLQDLIHAIVPFLVLYGIAGLGYVLAVFTLLRGRRRDWSLPLILGLALLFRLALLFTTPPTLSNDVYRYLWEGRLAQAGVNPYTHAVDSPALDSLDSPLRRQVAHSWMASPYLPAAQAVFWAIHAVAPDSPLAFQVAAILFDVLAGLLIVNMLRRLGRPRAWVLLYLWNPLVIVEFAHSAHLDAWMILLFTAALWALVAFRSRWIAVILLAAATLTKGLPLLVLPTLLQRWKGRHLLVYLALVVGVCTLFALEAGWGLTGPLDGRGLFGAMRIYGAYWNYNGGLYHWLEVALSGYRTTGAVPVEEVGLWPILAAKLIVAALMVATASVVWRAAQRCDDDLALLRLAAVPIGVYLLLAPTVHPWYVALILPLLPFLPAENRVGDREPSESVRAGESEQGLAIGGGDRLLATLLATIVSGLRSGEPLAGRFVWPWIYFSLTVALSYLTYLDPENLREYRLVRLVEYLPFYGLLQWAAWPAIAQAGRLAIGRWRRQRNSRWHS